MTDTKRSPVLIIGGGPAGFTAAIYAARANLNPIVVMGNEPGGQLMVTTDVENYPGFSETIQGPWLMEQMQAQAKHVGATLIQDMIESVDFSKKPFVGQGESGTIYEADAVIIATGAYAKWLDIESERTYRGAGVSACATCDGFFFKNKRVAIVGGGNTAVEEALFLTNHATHVTLIHRRDTLRAEKILQDRLFKHPKVSVLWNKEIQEIKGDTIPHRKVTGVRLKDTMTGEESVLDVEGVFVAIGHKPMTDIFKGQLEMDREGYLSVLPGTTQTAIPGVFAAGDVADKIYRQAVTAAGLGCMAALEALKYIQEKD
ncbi:MAG: thioredoxin-disulfide reductase [Alphaproteobacteria bacterium 16-39-46]|nr:MAG: thioredoxin-disulfide reductase [Alphaproteobacteria bacterium 16-39-46]OZA42591.1 MAG: thioredoxin-disulfide reductase [Alphaproteobacteria bacterium 17-39-52]HQS84175.1 thioredoxin-disulfide reductase [Alphaproteobacteria bacterium]HQS94036.1 thioredoxin-disulfide reductase [Alphaproteobacteria bacterium]